MCNPGGTSQYVAAYNVWDDSIGNLVGKGTIRFAASTPVPMTLVLKPVKGVSRRTPLEPVAESIVDAGFLQSCGSTSKARRSSWATSSFSGHTSMRCTPAR